MLKLAQRYVDRVRKGFAFRVLLPVERRRIQLRAGQIFFKILLVMLAPETYNCAPRWRRKCPGPLKGQWLEQVPVW